MVKASGQIEKELGLLQQRTEDMAEALDTLYGGYLKALGEASRQQMMSAVHHLCTQAYPDKFLALSWQQRNQLQKSVQVLAAQIATQLVEQRSQVEKASRQPAKSNGLAFLQQLLAAKASGSVIHTQAGSSDDLLDKLSEIARFKTDASYSDSEEAIDDEPSIESEELDDSSLDDSELDSSKLDDSKLDSYEEAGYSSFDFEEIGSESSEDLAQELDMASAEHEGDHDGEDFEGRDFDVDDVPAAEQRLVVSDEEDLLSALEALARRSDSDRKDDADSEEPLILTPMHLIKQQMLMEKAIQDVFHTVSNAVNELLQKAEVMPNFPKALMSAATDTRGLGEPLNAVPNVVKVSVRVMKGEANFDIDDEPVYREGENANKRRPRKLGRKGQSHRQNSHQDSNRDSRRNETRGESGSERRNEGRNERSRREFVPVEALEIDAFPELAAISLQLSEVEFADPRVSVWRSRLRKEMAHLKQLGMRYKKTQRSLETAQAEDAWRASWTAVEEP